MAEANIRINIEDASVNELNQEIARLNDELANTSRATEEGRAKIKALGKDINSLQGEVKNVEQSFAEVDIGAFVGEVGKVAAGLGAAGLALSSFGSENEEVAAVLEKTNAILALAATAEAIYTVTQEESQIALFAKTAATTAASVAQAAYTAVVGTSTGALKLFRLALVSTGIGAIVVAVGLLIANWDKLTAAVTGFVEKSEGLQKVFSFLQNIIPAVTGAIKAFFTNFADIAGSIGKILKGIFTLDLGAIKEGVNQAKNILVEGAQEAVAEAEQARRDAQELENRKNQQQQLDYEASRLEIVSDSEEEIFRAKEKAAQNRLRATQLEFGKESQEYKDAYLNLLKLQTDFNNKQQAEADKAAEERRKKRKEANAALLKAEADLEKARLGLFNLSTRERLDAIDKNLASEIKSVKASGKSRAEIQANTTRLELQAAADRLKIFEQEQLDKLAIAKQTNDAILKDLLEQAQLAGDADAVADIEAQIEARKQAFAQEVQNINDQTKASLEGLTILGEDQERLLSESLARVTQATEDFNTEVTQANEDAFDNILNTGVAAALESTADRIELKLRDIGEVYFKFEDGLLNATRKRLLEELRLERANIDANKGLVLQRIATIDQLLRSESLSIEERKKLQKELNDLKEESIDLDEQAEENTSAIAELYEQFLGEDVQGVLTASFDALNAGLDLINESINAISAEYDLATKKATDFYDTQIAAAEGNAQEIERLEAEKNEKLAALEAEKNQKVAKLQIQAANLQFAIAIGQIVANTSLAIMTALAQLGPVAGGIAAGIIAGTGILQLAAARNARSAAISQANALTTGGGSGSGDSRTQFAEGGYVSGPGTGTSDSINARLSNGEYVVNARSTAAFLPMLEQINNAGRGFAQGGMVSNGPDLTDILMRIERRLATPPKAYVVSTEIQQGLDTEQYLQRRAQLT